MKCEISYYKNNMASQQERYENDLKMSIDSLKKAHTKDLEACRLNYELDPAGGPAPLFIALIELA